MFPSHESRVEFHNNQVLLLRAGRIKVHFFPFRKEKKTFPPPKSTSSPNTIMLRRFNKASHDCNSLFTSPKPSTPKNRSRCQSPPSPSTHLTRKFPQRSELRKMEARKKHTKSSTPEAQRRRAEWRRRQAAAAGRTASATRAASGNYCVILSQMVNYRMVHRKRSESAYANCQVIGAAAPSRFGLGPC
jgi:hypothetical protein